MKKQDKNIKEKNFLPDYEEFFKGTNEKNVAGKLLLGLFKTNKMSFFVSSILFAVKHVGLWAVPIVTANVIDIASNPDERSLLGLFINGLILCILISQNIFSHVAYIKSLSNSLRSIGAGLRNSLVKKLQQLSITFHKEMQSGRIQSKLMRDVETIHTLSSQIFRTIPGLLINMITALAVVITRNLTVFAFFLMTIPSAVLVVRLFRKNIGKYNAKFRKDMESTSADIMDMIEMNQITRAHALENVQVKKLTGRLNAVANTGFKLDITHAKFGSVSWVMLSLFQLLCLVFSANLAISGKIEIGDISLYQSYFNTLTGQVSTLIGLLPVISKGLDSVSSIGEILGARDIEDNKGKKKLTTLQGEYEFRDVDFFYTPDQPVLQDLDLKVRAGETIAIVGESGSGKSTILNLVLGFNKPRMGKVFVDGRDMDEIDLQSYRKHIAIVPQTSVLFTGTIRENITYGFNRISQKRIDDAVKAANLTGLIQSLPNGLDTMLDEHGANLSGGQRQRIAIARAIIRNPKVIIFDEATSALDTVSEKEIQTALNNLTEGRTTFIVAHRLSTIRDADRIAVIKQGRCVEIGTYEELMAKKGEYYKMQTLQDGVK